MVCWRRSTVTTRTSVCSPPTVSAAKRQLRPSTGCQYRCKHPIGVLADACVRPSPETMPEHMIDLAERTRRHDMPVIHHPTEDHPVERKIRLGLCRRAFARMIARTFCRNAWPFCREGVISNLPCICARCWPRKSNPSSICVMRVFSAESVSPRTAKNCSTNGRTSFPRTSRGSRDDEVIGISHEMTLGLYLPRPRPNPSAGRPVAEHVQVHPTSCSQAPVR